jgi:uncharacterized protein YdiU (UPF0061 family)
MNTDNMSILGLTIDYGPFGFLDEFDAHFICNHSDYAGRYAFDQQPNVGLWNLYKFAQTLVPLIEIEDAEIILGEYQTVFTEQFAKLMRAKIGLQTYRVEDIELIDELFGILHENHIDYTLFFRRLCAFDSSENEKNDSLQRMFIDPNSFDVWATNYRIRLRQESSVDRERCEKMLKVNPKFVLRNHIAQMVIEEAQNGNYSEIDALRKVLQNPFKEHPEMERFYTLPPALGQRIAVSCSS